MATDLTIVQDHTALHVYQVLCEPAQVITPSEATLGTPAATTADQALLSEQAHFAYMLLGERSSRLIGDEADGGGGGEELPAAAVAILTTVTGRPVYQLIGNPALASRA